MADIELVIKISEKVYNARTHIEFDANLVTDEMGKSIANGTPLPKGHGELFDKTEILRFLKCPKYENCDWKNCFDCNESRCINLNNINDLVPIIEADKTGSEDK